MLGELPISRAIGATVVATVLAPAAPVFGTGATIGAFVTRTTAQQASEVIERTMAIVGNPSPFQWGEFVDSCTLTAAAWVVVDSYRAVPWFAIGRVASPTTDARVAH